MQISFTPPRCVVVLLLTAIIGPALSGCGGTAPTITSQKPSAAVEVDGNLNDWAGSIRKVDKAPYSMGIRNDGEFLYVSLVTIDADFSGQVLQRGMEIWFDPAGEKEHAFGIRFPLGLIASRVAAGGPPVMPDGTSGEMGGMGGRRNRGGIGDPEAAAAMEQAFNESLRFLQFMQDGEEGVVLPRDGIPGVEVSSTFYLGTLTYELKIPLVKSDRYQYAVGAAPGTVVGLGIETPKFDRDAMREAMGDDDGMRGRGAGSSGGMGGAPGEVGSFGRGGRAGAPRNARQQPEQIKHWTRVVLVGS